MKNRKNTLPSISTVTPTTVKSPLIIDVDCASFSSSSVIPPVFNEAHQINNPLIESETENVAYKPLKAVPPKKHIFASHLTCDTSFNDVEFYIKSKLHSTVEVTAKNFSFTNPRSMSSFKAAVPFGSLATANDLNFWSVNK